jgi:hypothetical protein
MGFTISLMKTRTDLLNHLAEKYNLQRYLEIGVQVPALNFDKIMCKCKIGVDSDPRACATFKKTSDEFFQMWATLKQPNVTIPLTNWHAIEKTFDLIFIDGLHTAEQVKKDFENALEVLSPNGFIVLHDCNPEKYEHTIVPRPDVRGHWNGDVYKFAAQMSTYDGLKFFTVDIDNGCTVVQMEINNEGQINNGWGVIKEFEQNTAWEIFDRDRKELLNLISWDEFVNL